MDRRTSGFAELAFLRLTVPVGGAVCLALAYWDWRWALGFALGAAGGAVGSYFNWVQLRKLVAAMDAQPPGAVPRVAFSGTLAGIAWMGGVLALSALSAWFDLFAAAAGLLLPKLLIGLTPFLRRQHGRDR